jgi:hypothetical protein
MDVVVANSGEIRIQDGQLTAELRLKRQAEDHEMVSPRAHLFGKV